MFTKIRLSKFSCFVLLFLTLTAGAQTTNESSLKEKITKVAERIGLPAAGIQEAIIAKNFTDKTSGIEYVYLQQTYKGIPVYNKLMTLAFKNDKLVYSSGKFLQKTERLAGNTSPVITAADALIKAAKHLRLPVAKNINGQSNRNDTAKKFIFSSAGIAKRDIEVKLYWAADSTEKLHLAWNVNIDVAGSADWWNVRVDAINGVIINKDNWTVYEQPHTTEAVKHSVTAYHNKISDYLAPPPNDVSNSSYYVIPFPADNVNVTSVTTVTDPWQNAGNNNAATTYGWHYNGQTTYSITRGNNVYAYNDSADKNTPGSTATSLTPLPDLTFAFTPDFTQPTFSSDNKSAALTNLFYWNNLMHDVMYQYGFNEAVGNFQVSNINRGGAGNDPVLAEAQDGSGVNNANFSTPEDGSSGRMQMYLWDAVNPPSFVINAPAAIAGNYTSIESGFSTANKLINVGPINDTIVLYTRDTLACSDTLPSNIKGKIALMYRGSCNFTDKVKNAQNAGAVAVIMVNTNGSDLIVMGGTDNTITIPAVMISYTDGSKILQSIKAGNTVTATLTGAPSIDGDFDNGIVCHEYGHGISHRLTGGNASCLDNAEKADEGWSDYFALMMTQDWANTQLADSAKSRAIGTYVFGEAPSEGGIRTYPYSINMTINPHTYANVSKNDGEVHYIGEIWCAALWDMTWGIIKQEGTINSNIYDANGAGGNSIALRLVMEGEKLQPCSPGFLDSRDAILAADSILYNSRYKCIIWNAFARRGMGVSAVQGSSYKTDDQTAAFDVPAVQLHKETLPLVNSLLTTNITLSCECQLPAGYKLTDTIPTGFSFSSSTPSAAVQGNLVTFNVSDFTALNQTKTYSITIVPIPSGGCAVDTSIYDDRDRHTTGGFVSSVTKGTVQWNATSSRAYSSTKSWYARETSSATDFNLTSDNFTPSNLSVLSFRHYLSTEAGYDGGMVEISINNGSTWTNAAPYFIANGYNGVIYEYKPADTTYGTTPLPAFTGSVNDSDFIQSVIDLSSFSGKSVKVRFRMYTDLGTDYDGWYVDDITLTNGCGGIHKINLYNNSGNVVNNAKVISFNTDSSGVLQPAFADFTVTAVDNTSALLNWSTISETNIKDFTVEHSTDSINFTTLTTTIAQGGSSNNYIENDNNPSTGTNFYRIRMNDSSGQAIYSPVRTATFTRNGVITIVPNPAVSQATVLLSADFNAKNIVIADMQGRIVYTAAISSGATSFLINTTRLSAGIYFVKLLSATGEVKVIKLMVTR